RPPKASGDGSPVDCLRRNFGIPARADRIYRPASPAPSRVVQVKALSSESKPDRTADSARQYVDPACVLPATLEPERHSTTFAPGRAIRPLRCGGRVRSDRAQARSSSRPENRGDGVPGRSPDPAHPTSRPGARPPRRMIGDLGRRWLAMPDGPRPEKGVDGLF